MRSQKTVLVLGAGASCGLGLPIGAQLKDSISQDLNISFAFNSQLESGSWEIVEALRALARARGESNINTFLTSARRIAQSMNLSGSIDEFVERHSAEKDVAICAKLAIAKAILLAERSSKIFLGNKRNITQVLNECSESWLSFFLRDVTKRKSADQIESAFSNISVINFNYDRCFEHFVYIWLQQMYGISEIDAAKITNSIKIWHPYGKIGNLDFEIGATKVPFGGEVSHSRLISISDMIRTYSEASELDENIYDFRRKIYESNKVVFFGFGFHEQNIELLRLGSEYERPAIRCYATTLGISAPRLEIYKQSLMECFSVISSQGFYFEPYSGNCEAFWHEFGDVVVQ